MSHDLDTEKQPSFEEEMEELETIVEQLENGDVALEEAIHLFQKGMKLSKSCHDKLKAVEEKIDQMIDEEGEIMPFTIQEEE
ncbi:exodeoxyribonuclease VII small subunit [Pueribacillus theae]|uniref:Exodeoxyribonuclease 7 small subunit n=1 Tax=Pueribacillus theae TaxID=2171751 RepID=A0A2U1K6Q5_9BACI|nr:exodeoxyribonuclease VII small subunit [Pueribacillus theae]PWA13210.1 exodeoxyribonuclease VII small subunit [Pueribacillus theae]